MRGRARQPRHHLIFKVQRTAAPVRRHRQGAGRRVGCRTGLRVAGVAPTDAARGPPAGPARRSDVPGAGTRRMAAVEHRRTPRPGLLQHVHGLGCPRRSGGDLLRGYATLAVWAGHMDLADQATVTRLVRMGRRAPREAAAVLDRAGPLDVVSGRGAQAAGARRRAECRPTAQRSPLAHGVRVPPRALRLAVPGPERTAQVLQRGHLPLTPLGVRWDEQGRERNPGQDPGARRDAYST